VPFLLDGLGGSTVRPWDEQEFGDPGDVAGLDQLDARVVLQQRWQEQTTEYDSYDEEYEDDGFARAVLRSWEDRFGARLLRVGFAQISVLARRPPRALEPAQRLAAEQWAFCSECAGEGLHDVPRIMASLIRSPIWTFWWD
jgi:hypothetical protein